MNICDRCEKRPTFPPSDPDAVYCEDCQQALMEIAYERSQSECFRGGEAAAYSAEQQAWIQRNLK